MRTTVPKRKTTKEDDVVLYESGPDEMIAYVRLSNEWAYKMRLVKQEHRWIARALSVFPNSSDFDTTRLSRSTRFKIGTGDSDGAYSAARELAHFAQHQADVRNAVPPGGLTARVLHSISFRGHPAIEGLQKLSALAKRFTLRRDREARDEILNQRDLRRMKTRSDRGKRLLKVARLYVAALNRGSRSPNEDIAQRLGISTAQVRDAVQRARKHNLLSKTGRQGRAGGQLTPTAAGWQLSIRWADSLIKQAAREMRDRKGVKRADC